MVALTFSSIILVVAVVFKRIAAGPLDIFGGIKKEELVCSNICNFESSLSSRAVAAFWSHDLLLAESCACNSLIHNKVDGISEAIRFECLYSKHMPSSYRLGGSGVNKPVKEPLLVLTEFEVLGPFPIGKLEVIAWCKRT